MNSDPRLIQIPDLWHIAVSLGCTRGAWKGKAVLETWHLAHDMKKALVAAWDTKGAVEARSFLLFEGDAEDSWPKDADMVIDPEAMEGN